MNRKIIVLFFLLLSIRVMGNKIAFYDFEGNAIDEISGFNGTTYGNPYTTTQAKSGSYSISNTAGSSYITLPSELIEVLENATEWSIVYWVYCPAGIDGENFIMSRRHDMGDGLVANLFLPPHPEASNWAFQLSSDWGNNIAYDSETDDNVWRRYNIEWNGSQYNVYQDGELKISTENLNNTFWGGTSDELLFLLRSNQGFGKSDLFVDKLSFFTDVLNGMEKLPESPTPTSCHNLNSIDNYLIAGGSDTFDNVGGTGKIIEVGDLTFYTTPAPPNDGIYCVGGFTETDYIKFDGIQCSHIANQPSGGIHFYWYPTNADTEQIVFSLHDGFYYGGHVGIAMASDRSVRFFNPAGGYRTLAPSGSVNLNNWNEFFFQWDNSGNIYFWLNGELTYKGYGLTGGGSLFSGYITRMVMGGGRLDQNGEGLVEYPISGYICQIHFFTSKAPIAPPFYDTCDATVIPTITPYKTYEWTPTPIATINPCGTPFPKVWTVVPSPIITPIATLDIVNCGEPDMIWHPEDGKFHMVISEQNPTIPDFPGIITLYITNSLNPQTGGNFERKGILIGNGVCEVQSAAMSKQVRMPGGFDRLYYSDRQDFKLYRIDSYNYGYNYVTETKAVAIDVNSLRDYEIWENQFAHINSTTVFQYNGVWYAIAELGAAYNFGKYLPWYLMWLFRSEDNGDTFYPYSPVPLYSMASSLGDIFAHPRSLFFGSNKFHIFEGVGLEGPIVHTQSYDLYNWVTDTDYTIAYNDPPQINWPNCDGWNQIGDSGAGVYYDGKTYFPFSQLKQDGSCAVIGLMVYNGNVLEYEQCGTPNPFTSTYTQTVIGTPTNSPTHTLTPRPTKTFTKTVTETNTSLPSITLTHTLTPRLTKTPTETEIITNTNTPLLSITLTHTLTPRITKTPPKL